MVELSMKSHQVSQHIYGYRTAIANVAFVGSCGTYGDQWVLVDAGVPFSGRFIKTFAERLYGTKTKPVAIVLTHAHFDHVGGLHYLLEEWDVPVYVHQTELPYVTGKKSYPRPHPFLEKGVMSFMSPLYPRAPIDVSSSVKVLPAHGYIEEMPGWTWYHTPGHTEGHISLFHEKDRMLLAGDAFITTKQESLLSVITQKPIIHGPPAYFTQDWERVYHSILTLKDLNPNTVFTGHGRPLSGEQLKLGLNKLIRRLENHLGMAEGFLAH